MTSPERHYEILDGFPSDVVAVSAHGRLTRADYEAFLIPRIEGVLQRTGKVKLLFVFGPDFSGYSAGAAWDDAKFGLLHVRDIAALAVVSDLTWIRLGVKAFAPFMACPVAVFDMADMDAARAWIAEWRHEPEPRTEVAADRKLPTLEDKM